MGVLGRETSLVQQYYIERYLQYTAMSHKSKKSRHTLGSGSQSALVLTPRQLAGVLGRN